MSSLGNSSVAKRIRTDALLAEMLNEYPGKPFTPQEISDYCGLDVSRINQIQRVALLKLKCDTTAKEIWKEMTRETSSHEKHLLKEYK